MFSLWNKLHITSQFYLKTESVEKVSKSGFLWAESSVFKIAQSVKNSTCTKWEFKFVSFSSFKYPAKWTNAKLFKWGYSKWPVFWERFKFIVHKNLRTGLDVLGVVKVKIIAALTSLKEPFYY